MVKNPQQSKKHKWKEEPTKHSTGRTHLINPKEIHEQKYLPHSENVVGDDAGIYVWTSVSLRLNAAELNCYHQEFREYLGNIYEDRTVIYF